MGGEAYRVRMPCCGLFSYVAVVVNTPVSWTLGISQAGKQAPFALYSSPGSCICSAALCCRPPVFSPRLYTNKQRLETRCGVCENRSQAGGVLMTDIVRHFPSFFSVFCLAYLQCVCVVPPAPQESLGGPSVLLVLSEQLPQRHWETEHTERLQVRPCGRPPWCRPSLQSNRGSHS